VREYVKRLKGSGRVTKFIALVKTHVGKGERFIVVSDRLFMIVLAYHVFLTCVCLIVDMRGYSKAKNGSLSGNVYLWSLVIRKSKRFSN